MIPELNDDGYLPAGIHAATLEEITARFGLEPELRRVQMESLRWLVELAKRVGMKRVVVNGSFVTDKWEPNDIDCVLLRGLAFPLDESADAELWAGLPFIQIAVVGQAEFDLFVETIYATDRHGNAKGWWRFFYEHRKPARAGTNPSQVEAAGGPTGGPGARAPRQSART